ncbi:hypothetical protein [Bdellovibrio svalbardensis]|uniref:Uncharacterized protein n=1 Tax=Bdellovibrio svalbardensis TaxID=2972972 RepID=A0ABT6DMR1_9BACT|nr:hypothetical protein [Bdellovibrio svalbardensis]MDG0816423.1 hypothetical protein [Bdellovibrio svalbardensis]
MKNAETIPADNSAIKDSKELKETKKTAPAKKKSLLKKLDPETGKLLQQLSDRANKKTHGKKIRDHEIISLGLSLILPEHLTALQERSLSEKDRLNIAHEDYQKLNGKITLDQFIGKLLRGETLLR